MRWRVWMSVASPVRSVVRTPVVRLTRLLMFTAFMLASSPWSMTFTTSCGPSGLNLPMAAPDRLDAVEVRGERDLMRQLEVLHEAGRLDRVHMRQNELLVGERAFERHVVVDAGQHGVQDRHGDRLPLAA